MSLIKSIFSKGASNLIKNSESLIDTIVTSDEEKLKLKQGLSALILNALEHLQQLQADVLKVEMTGNWLQRSWRPIVMLSFALLIFIGAFREIPYLSDTSPFWSLLEIGMGGYVIGRSAEQIAKSLSGNIDLSFLKKKDRKDLYK